MANNLNSNIEKRVAQVFAAEMESSKVLCKQVNTQYFTGANGVTPRTGSTVYMKRPTQYSALETVGGDLTNEDDNDIGVGQIAGTVQDYISIPLGWTNLEANTKLDQLQKLIAPATKEMITRLELNIARTMLRNAGLTFGTPGTPVTSWSHVAGMNALAESIGVPNDGNCNYVMNSFASVALAEKQHGLHTNNDMTKKAWERALVSTPLAGVNSFKSNALKSYQSGATTDREGALASAPLATYDAHKDSMIQTLALTGLTASVTDALRPGDTIEFDDVFYINTATREVVLDETGSPAKYRMTVVTGGSTSAGGAVTVTATNAVIAGTGQLERQYQTASKALESGDTFTVLGAPGVNYQPNLFFHRDAFTMSFVKLEKLQAQDSVIEMEDGMTIRITRGSDIRANKHIWRADIQPVFGIVNPLMIGKAYGKA